MEAPVTWREVVAYIRKRYPRATVTSSDGFSTMPTPKQRFIDVRIDDTLIVVELTWTNVNVVEIPKGLGCYIRPLAHHAVGARLHDGGLRTLTTVCNRLDKLPV